MCILATGVFTKLNLGPFSSPPFSCYSGCALLSFEPLSSAQAASKRARPGEDNQAIIQVIF